MSKAFERFKDIVETRLFNIAIVNDLPSIAEKGTIYLIHKTEYEREEYLWVDEINEYVLVDIIETEEEIGEKND